jgi:hypothetical protein
MVSFIYKITTDKNPKLIYIGSTFNDLEHRMKVHKVCYKKWIEKTINKRCRLFKAFKEYDIDTFKIEPLETINYDINKIELVTKEQALIDSFMKKEGLDVLNINKAYSGIDYCNMSKKEYFKLYDAKRNATEKRKKYFHDKYLEKQQLCA